MKIVFVGTSDFAIPSLKKLIDEGHNILACVTQPDKPKGRGRTMNISPVKAFACEHNITVLQPEKISTAESIAEIKMLGEPDSLVVVSYGQKIPQELLEYSKYGPVNVHGSLLPKYRGAAPVQYSLLMGDKITGVTTMFMEQGLDTGDILLQKQTEIKPGETAGELFDRLAAIGADLLIKTLDGLEKGSISPIPQDDSQATLARSLPSDAGKLDFEKTAEENINLFRSTTPYPGAYTFFNGAKLKIWKAQLASNVFGKCGEITQITKDGFYVACSEGGIFIKQVQPESKKQMAAADFVRGKRLSVGEKLG